MDNLIHEPLRLKVMLILLTEGESSFSYLLEKTGATDGNLSRHLRKLEDAGYIRVKKTFVKRRPKTTYRLTKKGKTALKKYIETLEEFIKRAKESGNI